MPEAVADEFERFFIAEGFALEDGTKLMGAYGSGSAKGRAFGGGFVGRRKYDLRIAFVAEGPVEAAVISAMSGWSGSLVGVAKERKGRKALTSRSRPTSRPSCEPDGYRNSRTRSMRPSVTW